MREARETPESQLSRNNKTTAVVVVVAAAAVAAVAAAIVIIGGEMVAGVVQKMLRSTRSILAHTRRTPFLKISLLYLSQSKHYGSV